MIDGGAHPRRLSLGFGGGIRASGKAVVRNMAASLGHPILGILRNIAKFLKAKFGDKPYLCHIIENSVKPVRLFLGLDYGVTPWSILTFERERREWRLG